MTDRAIAWLRATIEGDKALADRVAARYIAAAGSSREGEMIWPTTVVERAWQEYEDPDVRAGLDLIKAHGPQDVIADCEAKLALLDVHALVESDDQAECAVCVIWEDDESLGECAAVPVLWPCMTLEIMAAGYRHRPGYAEHWDARPCPACGKPDVVLPLGHSAAIPVNGGAPTCTVARPIDPAAFMLAPQD